MSIDVENIHLFMGPKELGSPDALLRVIVQFIDGAVKSLFIAVQEIDNEDITKAIIRAKERKVHVKIVVESDYLREKDSLENPFSPGGELEENRILQNAILRASIDIKSDYNGGIFHQKFIIRDSSAILTGSANFTDNDTKRNLNNIVIIEDQEIAKQYGNEFKEIQQGHFGKLNEGHDKKPKEIDVSNIRLKVLFAPDHNPEMEIMKQIAKAKRSIVFAIFTFAESSGIDDQLILVNKNGIKIFGTLFTSQANQEWAATKKLVDAGINLKFVPGKKNGDPWPRKLHHKIMVIDDQLIITGSFNYTGPANLINDENILIIGDLDSSDEESIIKQKKIASYVTEEIKRFTEIYS
jgi:phosphatidylserine/phosphatidylglycerophosphate/cardiolipin synthase-like enzyme